MTVLLALLLVMGLPWVETNVTVTGRQGESKPLGLLGWEKAAGWNTSAEPGVVFCVWTLPWPQVGLGSRMPQESVSMRVSGAWQLTWTPSGAGS